MKTTLRIIGACVLTTLSFMYVQNEPNPFEWTNSTRLTHVTALVCSALVSVLIKLLKQLHPW